MLNVWRTMLAIIFGYSLPIAIMIVLRGFTVPRDLSFFWVSAGIASASGLLCLTLRKDPDHA